MDAVFGAVLETFVKGRLSKRKTDDVPTLIPPNVTGTKTDTTKSRHTFCDACFT